jgi:hypothetical protein
LLTTLPLCFKLVGKLLGIRKIDKVSKFGRLQILRRLQNLPDHPRRSKVGRALITVWSTIVIISLPFLIAVRVRGGHSVKLRVAHLTVVKTLHHGQAIDRLKQS